MPAFVSGASRGIGEAVARRLAALGAPVAVGYRSRAADADRVVADIVAAGGRATAVGGDLSDEEAVAGVFAAIEAAFGPVGILVNNAGLHIGGRIQHVPTADWRAVIDANLTAAFLCSRAAVPGMVERRWGRIVNITSVVGLNGFPGDVPYASAKAGLIGLTRALALEVAGRQVTVNAIAPGFVDTEMTQALEPAVLERVERSIPLKRQATADEIAGAVEFLVGSGDYVTGSVVVVDGGWTLA